MSLASANPIESVLKHHLDVFLAKDVDGILEDYTEESVLLVNAVPEPIKGLSAIRAAFTQLLAGFTPEMIGQMSVRRQEVSGDVAYILWSAGKAIPFASDTFVVHDGKIVVQTAAVQMAQGA
jgi:ketosteroid isomerase-like protein